MIIEQQEYNKNTRGVRGMYGKKGILYIASLDQQNDLYTVRRESDREKERYIIEKRRVKGVYVIIIIIVIRRM